MKDKIKNIAEKLEHQIRMHELDLNDRIKDIPQIILLLEQGFSELKEIVSFYKFKSEMDEIFFFKIIKPKFFSKLIYYRKVYNIEMMRPNGQDCVLKNYFINELNQLENFYNKNIDFYKYYRSGSTHLDKYFFLRGKQDIQMTMETFYFERDPNFSTICDFKVAKIVANEMLRIYLTPLSLVSFWDLLGTCLGLASYMKRIEIYPECIPNTSRSRAVKCILGYAFTSFFSSEIKEKLRFSLYFSRFALPL